MFCSKWKTKLKETPLCFLLYNTKLELNDLLINKAVLTLKRISYISWCNFRCYSEEVLVLNMLLLHLIILTTNQITLLDSNHFSMQNKNIHGKTLELPIHLCAAHISVLQKIYILIHFK